MAKFGIGQSVSRSEDPRLLTGGGRYTDDIRLEGEAYAVYLRSPFAHAEITQLDVEEAKQAPGVLGVFTGEDLAADGIGDIPCYTPITNRDGSKFYAPPRPALARGRVRHVGEPVAMVVAETLIQAKDAAEMILADFDPLPAITNTAGTVAEGAPQIYDAAANNVCFDWGMGDEAETDALFDKAAHVIELEVVNNRVVANSMEGRACIASYDTVKDRYEFWVSSQGVHGLQKNLATDILKVPKDKLHVMTTDVGGGFGMKIFMYPEYCTTLYAAGKLKRPVRWIAERSEGFVSDDHGRDHVTRAKLAVDAGGKFLALKTDTISNLGAYLSNFAPFVATEAGHRMLNGLYTFEKIHARVQGVFTNTTPVDAYRGAGRPEAAFIVERIVDHAARVLGMDPVEIRKKNFIPPEAMPYQTATGLTYDSGEFARNLDEAVAIADLAGIDQRRREASARGKLRGLGIATYVEACAGGSPEASTIEVGGDGRVTVLIGTQTNGQGHETAYKQVVAEYLGVEPDAITVVQGDTDRIATGGGTGGSRSIPVGGQAIAEAALKIQDKAKARAAEMLEAAAADIVFEDGRFSIVGTDRSVTLQEIAKQIGGDTAFDETGDFKPPAATFPNGAHIVELDIDRATGEVEILKYTVVDDFGRVLNPLMVAGQVHGGVAQGIGQALHEHTVYDDEGQLLSGSFMDYCMPRADDLPFLTFKYNEIPCTTNPMGVKGAGEAGAIGAPPAVINAVVDALAPYGVAHVDMPATPETLWRLIDRAEPGLAAE
jgi:carbon-monoxide dehydrogenase large subunit